MPAIGYVTRTEKGFKGNLKTLSIKAPIEIAHNANKTAEKQPDYLIFVEGVEVGAAWNRVSNTWAAARHCAFSPVMELGSSLISYLHKPSRCS